MKNNTFEEIAQVIENSQNILLFPHINMDGDALGSCIALCIAMRKMGKNAYILIEDDIPLSLQFMGEDYCTKNLDIIDNPDLCMCIDCGDSSRFPKRKERFESGKTKVCIDHHRTSSAIFDYNYIDGQTAAAGELVFKLLMAMGAELDRESANALFAAISTDTGNFTYSNTTKQSHEIIAKLYDYGVDANEVSCEIYENMRIERVLIENKIIDTMQLYADGQVAIAFVTQKMLEETGATMDETEGAVQRLRSIRGVEVAAFLKEESEHVKVSLRSKKYIDVAEIASSFSGGGHIRAAGCTIYTSIEEACDLVKNKILEMLDK